MDEMRVLLVDNDGAARDAMRRALEGFVCRAPGDGGECGFSVGEACDSCGGCAEIIESPPDILVLDNTLPCLSGEDLICQMRACAGDMCVILTDPAASVECAMDAAHRGAWDLLPKPFSTAQFLHAVEKAAHRQFLLRRTRALEQERHRVRFEFVSVLAHELKSPLSAVESCLNVIHSRTLGGELDAYDEFIGRASARLENMRRMVDDLLDLTRLESGERPRRIEYVDAVELARDAMDAQADRAREKGVVLRMDAPSGMMLRADRWEIATVLANLVSNAVKYNRPGGEVAVRMGFQGDRAVIAVADTGIGIAPEEQDRLFRDFGRLRNKNTDGILGTGLGLSIVRKIAALNGGSIALESAPGAGSTFTLSLPRCHGANAAGR